MEPKYAVRCLSKVLIRVLLKHKLQGRDSLWVLRLMAELEYGFSPHLDALVATSYDRREEVDEVRF